MVDLFVYRVPTYDNWGSWAPYTHSALNNERWHEVWTAAAKLAGRLSWDGSIGVGPVIYKLPGFDMMASDPFIIGWAQASDGVVFLACRYRLPWVESHPAHGVAYDSDAAV